MTTLLVGSVALSGALLTGALGLFIKARARERASRELPELSALVKKLKEKASDLERQIFQLEAQKRRAEHALNIARSHVKPEMLFSMEVSPSELLSSVLGVADIELVKLADIPGARLTMEAHAWSREEEIELRNILCRGSHAQMKMLFKMYEGMSLAQIFGEDNGAVSYDIQLWLSMQEMPGVEQAPRDGSP